MVLIRELLLLVVVLIRFQEPRYFGLFEAVSTQPMLLARSIEYLERLLTEFAMRLDLVLIRELLLLVVVLIQFQEPRYLVLFEAVSTQPMLSARSIEYLERLLTEFAMGLDMVLIRELLLLVVVLIQFQEPRYFVLFEAVSTQPMLLARSIEYLERLLTEFAMGLDMVLIRELLLLVVVLIQFQEPRYFVLFEAVSTQPMLLARSIEYLERLLTEFAMGLDMVLIRELLLLVVVLIQFQEPRYFVLFEAVSTQPMLLARSIEYLERLLTEFAMGLDMVSIRELLLLVVVLIQFQEPRYFVLFEAVSTQPMLLARSIEYLERLLTEFAMGLDMVLIRELLLLVVVLIQFQEPRYFVLCEAVSTQPMLLARSIEYLERLLTEFAMELDMVLIRELLLLVVVLIQFQEPRYFVLFEAVSTQPMLLARSIVYLERLLTEFAMGLNMVLIRELLLLVVVLIQFQEPRYFVLFEAVSTQPMLLARSIEYLERLLTEFAMGLDMVSIRELLLLVVVLIQFQEPRYFVLFEAVSTQPMLLARSIEYLERLLTEFAMGLDMVLIRELLLLVVVLIQFQEPRYFVLCEAVSTQPMLLARSIEYLERLLTEFAMELDMVLIRELLLLVVVLIQFQEPRYFVLFEAVSTQPMLLARSIVYLERLLTEFAMGLNMVLIRELLLLVVVLIQFQEPRYFVLFEAVSTQPMLLARSIEYLERLLTEFAIGLDMVLIRELLLLVVVLIQFQEPRYFVLFEAVSTQPMLLARSIEYLERLLTEFAMGLDRVLIRELLLLVVVLIQFQEPRYFVLFEAVSTQPMLLARSIEYLERLLTEFAMELDTVLIRKLLLLVVVLIQFQEPRYFVLFEAVSTQPMLLARSIEYLERLLTEFAMGLDMVLIRELLLLVVVLIQFQEPRYFVLFEAVSTQPMLLARSIEYLERLLTGLIHWLFPVANILLLK